MTNAQTSPSRYFAILFLITCAMLWGLSSLSHGPKPKGVDAPVDQFSAMRAFADLQDLVGNNQPHPSGSAENLRIRKAIEAKFQALGYTVEIQQTLGCTLHYPGCTEVENIIVRHKGTGGGDAIMLTSHYDSVPAGPAAADDGAGVVAMLEIARILKAGEPLKNDIIFLITDGEEGGLRGAAAFNDQHNMMKDVKLIVNLESRGVSGPSSMFETSAQNLELIRGFARTTPHPVANSLSYEVYSRLPNDTDYSIYKPSGVMGFNFAFTGDVALYHSRHDNVENLDKNSLQHHGENMLSIVQAFGNADMEDLKSETNATYIDVFGKFLLHWPAKLNVPLSIFPLMIFLQSIFWKSGLSKTQSNIGKTFTSLGASIAVIALTGAFGWILSFPLGHWPDLFYLDHPYPWAGRLTMMAAALLAVWWLSFLLRNRLNYNSLVLVTGTLFSIGALTLSLVVPGASYMLMIPAFGMAIGLSIDLWRKHQDFKIAAHIGLVLMAYMAFYHFIVLEVILHYKLSAVRILPLALLGLSLLPILHKRMSSISKFFGPSLVVITVGLAVVSFLLPGFNLTHPRMQNIIYVQGHQAGKAVWVSETSGRQDEKFTKAAGFTDKLNRSDVYRILWGKAKAKPAAAAKFPAPTYILMSDEVSGDWRKITLDIKSANGGFALMLGFKRNAAPANVTVNGQMAADYTQKPYRRPLAIRGGKMNTYKIVITLKTDTPLNMALIDSFSLVDAQLEGMAELRPDVSAPLHSGDRAHVFTLIDFKANP